MVASVEYHTNFHTGSYGGVQHPSQGSWGARSVVALAMTAVAVVALASLSKGAAAQTYQQECSYDIFNGMVCWMKECHLEEVCTHVFGLQFCHLEEVCTNFK